MKRSAREDKPIHPIIINAMVPRWKTNRSNEDVARERLLVASRSTARNARLDKIYQTASGLVRG
jgi:hypothetical protein